MTTPERLLRLGSSLRTRLPGDTYALASGLMAPLGISRVTDITCLDRLGLPVFASVRPRGLALCVHAGKGMQACDARTGALMEAVEFAVAEPGRTPWDRQVVSVGDLRAEWATRLRMLELAPRMGPGAPNERLIDVLACEDILGGDALRLPAELIFVPFDDGRGDATFGWSTNGLASGNTLAEATLHGLMEVLERDAVAMNMAFDESRWISPSQLPAPFDELAARWDRDGVKLAVRFVPNAFGLPCFMSLLHEPGGAFVNLACGYGFHVDPHVALGRAVCEAAQSRLSHIHGGRDDITHFYAKWAPGLPAPDAVDPRDSPAWRAGFDTCRTMDWGAVALVDDAMSIGSTIDSVLADVLARLRERGFTRVLRHRFAIDLNGLHVVKIVVPGCQEIDTPFQRMGARLYERICAHA